MNLQKLLSSGSVVISNMSRVEEKIQGLVRDGAEKLQMIVDFDYTLTKTNVECSWGVLETYSELPDSYHTRVKAAKEKYLPIELDLSISVEEKIPLMIEWYKEANQCLSESGVKQSWIPKMVTQSNCELRDDTDKMLSLLHAADVPVLVMSAGVGDLIKEIMTHFSVLHTNTSLVSNFLKFDSEGNIVGLSTRDEDMIHMYNKAEVIRRRRGEHSHDQRRNVILMGDSLGDLDMAAGVRDPDIVLTIGFLNKNIEKNLPTYKEKFDVVLVDDQTMNFPNDLLENILVNQKTSSAAQAV